MKTGRRPTKRAKKLETMCGESVDLTGVQKSRKIMSRERKALDNVHIEDELENAQSLVDRTETTEMTERLPLLHLNPTQMSYPRTKIKLQLFPINEKTRTALEKDGYNPYLELTLRSRKKISSVLNHLITKWGCSNVARGELTLFPYSKASSLASGLKWTLKDCDISAGDVYAAVGDSSIFRLRYGWVSTSIPLKLHSSLQGLEKGCSSAAQIMHREVKQSEETMVNNIKSSNTNDVDNTVAPEKTVVFPSNSRGNEPPLDSGYPLSSKGGMLLQFDSLSNISMGGLLSEASLLGKCSSWGSKTTGAQPAEVITDSLDACIAAAQMRFSGVSKHPHNDQHSSILDAEQTCDAFAMKRISSSSKDTLSLDASAGGTFQDADSKLFKFPKTLQAHSRSELSQDPADKESKTDLIFCSRYYQDETSLGLSDINWSYSLGPFDLGLPDSRKVSPSGDGLNMSGFVR